jgi:hypothetical protein
VAVAPKLAILLHDLWVTGEVYEALRNSQGAARRPSCRLTEFWFCANRRVRVTARSRWNERNWKRRRSVRHGDGGTRWNQRESAVVEKKEGRERAPPVGGQQPSR